MSRMYSGLIRRTLALMGGALAAFHGWLFVAQAASGRLEDPWLIFRWIAAASLIAAFAAVVRGGGSVWGRKGIAIWVLAGLLHGPAVAGEADITTIAVAETVSNSVVQLLSAAAFAASLLVLASLLRARQRLSQKFSLFVPVLGAPAHLAAGITPQFSPRPPPADA